MKKTTELFLSFLKIGAFTIGGGYAMIPLMQQEIVEKKKWLKPEEVIDMVAISESTPGVLAVNFATYVGYKVAGFWGSIVATLSVVLPAFLIILLLSTVLAAYQDSAVVQAVLKGIKAGVVVLLMRAIVKLVKICRLTPFNLVMILATVLVSLLVKGIVFYVLISGALIGIIYGLIWKKEGHKE